MNIGLNAVLHTTDGYDDNHFHKEVIPNMKCSKCGETSITLGNKTTSSPDIPAHIVL